MSDYVGEGGAVVGPAREDTDSAVSGKIECDSLLDLVWHGWVSENLKVAVSVHVHEARAQGQAGAVNDLGTFGFFF